MPPAATVRWIGRAVTVRWPEAAQAVGDLEFLAERELYAAEPSPYGALEVRRVWQDLMRAMKGERARD